MIAPTYLARVPCDENTARRLADRLTESIDADIAVSAFEAAPGAWSVEIYFSDPPDETAIRNLIAAGDPAAAQALRFETLSQRDWVAESLSGLKRVEAGRFIVHGRHERAHLPSARIAIEIEASLAFGTGHHGTTRGCLLALDRIARSWPKRPGRRRRPHVLDVGTGTGVLAIAAAKRLPVRVLGSDIDPVAVRVAKLNVRINGAGNSVEIVLAAGVTRRAVKSRGPYDLVFANILLSPLRRLASPLAGSLRPGAHLILSGLLTSQASAALAAYRPQGVALVRRIDLEGWTTLIMERRRIPRRQA